MVRRIPLLLFIGLAWGQYEYLYDSSATDLTVLDATVHLFPNSFDGTTNSYNGNFLVMSSIDASGDNVHDEIIELVEDGDIIRIENGDGSKFLSFTASGAWDLGGDRVRVAFYPTPIYSGPPGEGFNDFESVLFENVIFIYPETIFPTILDTFSTHIENDSLINFRWHPSVLNYSDSLIYTLTIELEFFGNTFTDIYDNITDTTLSISANNLDALLSALDLTESSINWFVDAYDGAYSVRSDTGQFVLNRELLLVDDLQVPSKYSLQQNYPNPFNPVTTLRYDLPENALVNITIYDMMGRVIKTLVNGSQTAGYKTIQWNATNDKNRSVSAGLFLYTIEAGKFRQTKKMVLLK
jgi:hypothetical protein